jgi:N-acetyl-1-D-myo-inositol-2-amino-2-deoxy-alpha-D-glucopyranoside deacetylase/mycothiol S-conjugate amidase
MSGRVLMFVGAHPDDETFGPGGTLAHYAAEGVRVIYACATRGEAGSAEPDDLGGQRWAELMSAAKALRLASVLLLGYRDSGMPGWPENRHPRALVMAALEDVTREVVAVIRSERPQVVITFDPIGGYHHPDHIAIHQATVRAFQLAGDPTQYPGVGEPFSPQKLYFWNCGLPCSVRSAGIRAAPGATATWIWPASPGCGSRCTPASVCPRRRSAARWRRCAVMRARSDRRI